MSLQIQKSSFELHPEGFYEAEIKDIQEEDSQYGPRAKFVIETDEKAENGEDKLAIWHYCSMKLSPKSKLSKTVTGILGIDYAELPENFDLESLKETKCQITVKHTESQSGKEYAKIESFLPVNGKSELSDKMIARLKELMQKNNIDVGVLQNFYDVDAVEKLNKSQATEFGKKMSSGELTFETPEDDSDDDDVDIDGIPF